MKNAPYMTVFGVTALLLPLNCDAQERQNVPVYSNGRIIIPPARLPQKTTSIYKSSDNHPILQKTDRSKGTSFTEDLLQRYAISLGNQKSEYEKLLRELRSKGYIR